MEQLKDMLNNGTDAIKQQILGDQTESGKLNQARAETLGWAYAYACDLLDKGIDLRKIEVPEMLAQAKQDLHWND